MVSVSIALATYNGEKFLHRQLQSLAWQTHLPDELIITDDCSTDGTVDILQDFRRSAPFPVRMVVNERSLNFRANFIKGAGLCTSDLILFCDQDDVWRPEKVATVASVFADDPELLLAYHNATIVDEHERGLFTMFDPAEQKEILARDVSPPWHFARGLVQVFRRELLAFNDLWHLSREHFDSERLGHDRWYFFLAQATGRVRFIDKDLLMYRQHGANAFGADRGLGWAERIREKWVHHPSSDDLGARGARSRVAILQAMQPRVSPEKHARLELLAQAYAEYADRLERRFRTFSDNSLPARSAALVRSVVRGDYRGNPWGFDPRSILRDAWLGVAGVGR